MADGADDLVDAARDVEAAATGAGPFIVQSARVAEAVASVEQHLAEGKRIVQLRGAPGDGKTQVARWLGSRLGPGAVYVELPIPHVDAEHDVEGVWREGLVRTVERMNGDASKKDDLSGLCKAVREAAAGLPKPVTLILDNADSNPPFDLRDLLVEPEMACVAIGQGFFNASTVDLRRPSSDEFIEMVSDALGGVAVAPGRVPTVQRLGSLLDHAAIAAGYVADLVASDIPEELRALERELEAVEFSVDRRMRIVLEKAWASLGGESRVTASLLAAFAEPEIPLAWVPEAHRRAGAVTALIRSRLVQPARDGEATILRAHRLVIQWLRSLERGTGDNAVAEVLYAWSIDEELDEVFKSGGPRKRAFNCAFELLARRRAFDALGQKARAFIELTYIDQSGIHAEGAEDARVLERQIAFLAPADDELAHRHPAVLGQLIDTLRPGMLEQSQRLREVRAFAIEVIDGWRRSDPTRPRDQDNALAFIAEHHWGKYLAHSERAAEGLVVLRDADAWASAVLAKSEIHDRQLWLVRRAKVRLQLADALAPQASEARQFLLEDFENAELPPYLRLTAGTRLIKRSSVPIGTLVKMGFEPYERCRHEEIAADFLAAAVSAAREEEAVAVLDEIASIASEKLDALLAGGPGSQRRKTAVAFINAKVAEGRTSGDALTVLVRAMRLLSGVLLADKAYHRTRALASSRPRMARIGGIRDEKQPSPSPRHARRSLWSGR